MNPRHSMQGRRFLFKEIGGSRGFLFWGAVYAFIAFGLVGSSWSSDWKLRREKPKTYITQEEFWRHRALALEKRQELPFQIFCTEEQRQRMTALLIEIQETGGRF